MPNVYVALGHEHPYVAETLTGLASLRAQESRSAEAVALCERALTIKQRTLAAGHPELAAIRTALDATRRSSR